jgi:hypothetical protein
VSLFYIASINLQIIKNKQNKQNKQNNYIRSDFIFSYWIFLWFILYQQKFVPYNPKNAISIGIMVNFIMLLYLLHKKTKTYNTVKFIIINSIIKIIPLILVWKTKTTKLDNYFCVVLFCAYILWIYYNDKTKKQTMNQTYEDLFTAYLNDGNNNKKTVLSHQYDIIIMTLLNGINKSIS